MWRLLSSKAKGRKYFRKRKGILALKIKKESFRFSKSTISGSARWENIFWPGQKWIAPRISSGPLITALYEIFTFWNFKRNRTNNRLYHDKALLNQSFGFRLGVCKNSNFLFNFLVHLKILQDCHHSPPISLD